MKNILIIGGSKNWNAILLQQLEKNLVHNISRNPPEVSTLPNSLFAGCTGTHSK
jgi:hypothetical protein